MDMNTQRPDFKSILSLLKAGVPVGVLAQAVEMAGVEGWDRYGRWCKSDEKSESSKLALDALALVYSWSNKFHRPEELSPLDDAENSPEDGSPLHFGWSVMNLPNFASIESGLTLKQDVGKKIAGQAGGESKGEKMDLRLIGALYKFIKGEFSPHVHEDFVDQRKFVRLLDNKLDSAAGTAGSLEKKLKRAIDELDSALQKESGIGTRN